MTNKLFYDTSLPPRIKDKAIFLDNDFLSVLFSDESVLAQFIKLFPKNIILIDPLTEFEFLRSMYDPKQRMLMKKFVANAYFSKYDLTSYYKNYPQQVENSLLLSRIYAHKKASFNASLVDLLLAATLMFLSEYAVLITGNKKDFPSCIFDIESVLNLEDKASGQVRAYSIIRFNKLKFNSCNDDLKKLQDEYDKENSGTATVK